MEATYNYKVVRQFAIMTVVWGIVGMLVGVIIAAQLIWPTFTEALGPLAPYLSYGRLRPLHTNAVIFAFGGSALFASSLYVVQRTCQARLISDGLASFVFWGWQLVILSAVVTLPLGITQSKEYAELEWPVDLLITAVWVAYAIVFFGTIGIRKTKHIYVANWFFGAFILTVPFFKIAETLDEYQQAFRLVHDSYSSLGYVTPSADFRIDGIRGDRGSLAGHLQRAQANALANGLQNIRVCQADLSPLLDGFVYGLATMDVAVVGVQSLALPDARSNNTLGQILLHLQMLREEGGRHG